MLYMRALCHFDRPSNVEIGVKLKYWMFVVVIILLTIALPSFAFWGTFKFNYDQNWQLKRKQRFNFQHHIQRPWNDTIHDLNHALELYSKYDLTLAWHSPIQFHNKKKLVKTYLVKLRLCSNRSPSCPLSANMARNVWINSS